jgi:predicted CXXCH cytochrome family protein
MKARVIIGTLAILLLFFSGVYSLLEEPHSFTEDECMRCHLTEPQGKTGPLPLVARESELCSDCHDVSESLLTHPVDVTPEHTRIPADMPLSLEGTLTCSTCHDIHSSYRTPFGTPSHFLRRQVSGRQFCIICHRESVGGESLSHAEVIEQAHFKSRYYITDNSRTIDDVSAECLSCHDGSVGKLSVIGVGNWSHSEGFMSYDSGTHPIGVSYRDAFRKSPDGFRPPSMLDERIKLVNGQVSCISCHNLYAETPMKLVMSNEKSRLCLACHIK